MDEFQGARMAFGQVDAGDAAVVDLTEELPEVRAALVPHPGIGEESGLVACLYDAVGEVDVLTKAHFRETAQLEVDIATDAHVEGTGIELVKFGLAPSDAARGEEGGHGVGDGLLDRRKGGVGSVGAAKGGKIRVDSG